MMVPTLIAVVMLATILAVLGQTVPRPTQGYQIGDPPGGIDIIMPLSVTQCEPVLIYYENSFTYLVNIFLFTPDDIYGLLVLDIPPGVGYLDWVCNIPTAYSFIANSYQGGQIQYYTVQPGSSSACLGDVTTTYSYADYQTTRFQSYIQHSPSGDPFYSTSYQGSTIAFPTSSLTTITANPNLAVRSTTTASTVSSSSSPPPTSSTHKKSNKVVLASGVVAGIAFILLTIAFLFIFLRRRRNSLPDAALGSLTVESALEPYSGLMASQPPAPATYFSAPLLPSLERPSYTDSTDAVHGNISRTAVADARRRNHIPFMMHAGALTLHTAGTISSSAPAAAVPPVPPKTENIVLSHHSPDQSTNESQNLHADVIAGFDAAGLTAGQQQVLLNASSADPATAETSSPLVDIQSLTAQPQSLITNEVTREGLQDVASNVLDDISRARPSPGEQHTLVTSLHQLLMPDQVMPADLTRSNTVTAPPPYEE